MSAGALYQAVKAVLDRAQTNPDLGHLIAPGYETFCLLCVAEAEHLGQSVEEVQERRAVDLQPPHSKRRPDVVVMKELLDKLDPDWREKV